MLNHQASQERFDSSELTFLRPPLVARAQLAKSDDEKLLLIALAVTWYAKAGRLPRVEPMQRLANTGIREFGQRAERGL